MKLWDLSVPFTPKASRSALVAKRKHEGCNKPKSTIYFPNIAKNVHGEVNSSVFFCMRSFQFIG